MADWNFKNCRKKLDRHEGGWSNNPKDPGGATMRGVIQRNYDVYRKRKGLPLVSVRYITEAEVDEIYRTRYWDLCKGDYLPAGLDYATFDGAVNSGVSRGVKWLQKAIGASVDGKAGNETVTKAKTCVEPTQAIRTMCGLRLGFLQRLRHWNTFKRGWTRRVAEVEVDATKMYLAYAGYSEKSQRQHLDNSAVQVSTEKRKQAKAAQGSAAAGGASGVSADQVDPAFYLQSELLWIFAGLCVCGVLFFLYKRHVSGERLAAYGQRISALAKKL